MRAAAAREPRRPPRRWPRRRTTGAWRRDRGRAEPRPPRSRSPRAALETAEAERDPRPRHAPSRPRRRARGRAWPRADRSSARLAEEEATGDREGRPAARWPSRRRGAGRRPGLAGRRRGGARRGHPGVPRQGRVPSRTSRRARLRWSWRSARRRDGAGCDARERRFLDAVSGAGGGLLADAVQRDGTARRGGCWRGPRGCRTCAACLAVQATLPGGWIVVPRDGSAVVGELGGRRSARASRCLQRRAEASDTRRRGRAAGGVGRHRRRAAAAERIGRCRRGEDGAGRRPDRRVPRHDRSPDRRRGRAGGGTGRGGRRSARPPGPRRRPSGSATTMRRASAALAAMEGPRTVGDRRGRAARPRPSRPPARSRRGRRARPRCAHDATAWPSRPRPPTPPDGRPRRDGPGPRPGSPSPRSGWPAPIASSRASMPAAATSPRSGIACARTSRRPSWPRRPPGRRSPSSTPPTPRTGSGSRPPSTERPRRASGSVPPTTGCARPTARSSRRASGSTRSARACSSTWPGSASSASRISAAVSGTTLAGSRGRPRSRPPAAPTSADGLAEADIDRRRRHRRLRGGARRGCRPLGRRAADRDPRPGRPASASSAGGSTSSARSNPYAVDEYAELKTRLETLETQATDLRTAIVRTRELIAELDTMIADQFRTTFQALEVAFAAPVRAAVRRRVRPALADRPVGPRLDRRRDRRPAARQEGAGAGDAVGR